MCGIIGIFGKDSDVVSRLLEGLSRLEYRGYDSAGIATLCDGQINTTRAKGKISMLSEKLAQNKLQGCKGIGHTRWATHGKPTEINAHPHSTLKVAVVHNGIIENYAELKTSLEGKGRIFKSETDTEVIAHLITHNLDCGMNYKDAAFKAFGELKGAYAVAVLFADEDAPIIGVRNGTPLALGYGNNEMFLASDSYALAPLTNKVCFLEDGDRVIITNNSVQIFGDDEKEVKRPIKQSIQSGSSVGKDGHKHFMHKEMHEQPAVLGALLSNLIDPINENILFEGGVLDILEKTPRLTMSACGTAAYACNVAQYWFEQHARLPCSVDVASEFRYRTPPLPKNGGALFVSQSGETLDTLEALRYCKKNGQKIISLVNTVESTMERESDIAINTRAGAEIGVASTKATSAQLTVLACLCLGLAKKQGVSISNNITALRKLPALVADVLDEKEDEIAALARNISSYNHMFYVGRGSLYPIAEEGALKMKELSYIHAQAYAGGEFKHGPIALVDENLPTIALVPSNDPLFDKMHANLAEISARGGKILLISDKDGINSCKDVATWNLEMPKVDPFATPILYLIPLQLLAYHAALAKGTDADQPRNLAKSVTVE